MEFEDQLLIYKTNDDNYNGDPDFFSSILRINENANNRFESPPLIKYEYFDDNNDGLIDKFKFKITFIKENQEIIRNIKLVFSFKYEFRVNIVGRMNTVALVDIDTPLGGTYIQVDGNLNLKQKSPIDRTTFYDENIYRNIFKNQNEVKPFCKIAKDYYDRDFSTYFDYDTYIVPMKNPKIVRIEVNINIPSFQKILYKTPIFTKIKFFWVQYVAVLLPVAGIFYFIMQFVFRNYIVNTINSNDIGVKKKKIL